MTPVVENLVLRRGYIGHILWKYIISVEFQAEIRQAECMVICMFMVHGICTGPDVGFIDLSHVPTHN